MNKKDDEEKKKRKGIDLMEAQRSEHSRCLSLTANKWALPNSQVDLDPSGRSESQSTRP